MSPLRRPPSQVEAAVDWRGLQDLIDTGARRIGALVSSQIRAWISELEPKLLAIGHLRSLDLLFLEIPGPWLQQLLDAQVLVMHDASALAVEEGAFNGVQLQRVPDQEIVAMAAARVHATAFMLGDHVATTAQARVLRLTHDQIDAPVVADTQSYLRGLAWQWPADQVVGMVMAGVNWARLETFETHKLPPQLRAAAGDEAEPEVRYFASEILDRNTCDPCADWDGHEFSDRSAAEKQYPTGGNRDCFGGPRCRGTLVADFIGGEDGA